MKNPHSRPYRNPSRSPILVLKALYCGALVSLPTAICWPSPLTGRWQRSGVQGLVFHGFCCRDYAHLVVASSARFVQDWESQVSLLKGSGDHELAAVSDPRGFFYVRGCKFQGPQTSKDTRYTDPRPVPSPPGKMSFGARWLGFRALSLCLNQRAFWLLSLISQGAKQLKQ